ncbi:dihydropteroate synthase [Formosa sediminum]|uniref:dihydropteroate synthase n=1 Tax=Formosa sediminum TaxID=2594004 RepID=A0A516GVX4_9FLAO|nr:dihydropteroate synthase [Formosa sediminum]QDO95625.1 dihydropteroate synthase [Formosa sediminum]
MGILNLTPDSFYDGGSYKNETDIITQVKKMLDDGAVFIDVGAYSSRPNADHVSEAEELARILPVVELLVKTFPDILVSVDTFRSGVAKACVNAGAALINDISAGQLDPLMLETVGKLNVPYIMMHMLGTPQTMQQHTSYQDILKEILFYFSERITLARQHGIIDIIIDPGFGFSKTLQQNFELLNRLELLKITELPMLVGVSRKSMIYKTLKQSAQDALNGTTVINTISLQKGASVLRVHDVKEAMECITLVNALN